MPSPADIFSYEAVFERAVAQLLADSGLPLRAWSLFDQLTGIDAQGLPEFSAVPDDVVLIRCVMGEINDDRLIMRALAGDYAGEFASEAAGATCEIEIIHRMPLRSATPADPAVPLSVYARFLRQRGQIRATLFHGRERLNSLLADHYDILGLTLGQPRHVVDAQRKCHEATEVFRFRFTYRNPLTD